MSTYVQFTVRFRVVDADALRAAHQPLVQSGACDPTDDLALMADRLLSDLVCQPTDGDGNPPGDYIYQEWGLDRFETADPHTLTY